MEALGNVWKRYGTVMEAMERLWKPWNGYGSYGTVREPMERLG